MLTLGLDSDWSWRRREEAEARAITLADFPQLALSPPGVGGVTVTETTALNFSAYFNGVDIISSQVASLPRIPYERSDSGARVRLKGTPLARVLDQPNPAMTDFVFWQTLVAHMLTWGNGYAEIEWDRALRPLALWPIAPDAMTPTVVNGRLVYKYGSRRDPIPAEDVIHVPGLGFDGLRGYSVVSMARRSIGLGVAAEAFGGSFFGNGARPGVLLEHPKTLTTAAALRLKEGWDAMHRGADNAHATAVLEEGMKASTIGIPPNDAQFLETREFQVVEIARWLNLPVRKLKVGGGTAPTTPESGQIEFLTDTLRPWLVRIEQELARKLIVPALRSTYYVEHLADAILRMDGSARAASYKVYFDMGVLDAEQIAEKENLPKPKPKPAPAAAPPPPPGEGVDDDDENPAPTPLPPPPPTMNSLDQHARLAAADRANLAEAAGRFVKRETRAVRRAVRPGALSQRAFREAVEEFYRDELPVLRGLLVPAVRLSLACRNVHADAVEVSRVIADRYVLASRAVLADLPAKDIEARAEHVVARWTTTRADELADEILNYEGSL